MGMWLGTNVRKKGQTRNTPDALLKGPAFPEVCTMTLSGSLKQEARDTTSEAVASHRHPMHVQVRACACARDPFAAHKLTSSISSEPRPLPESEGRNCA
jgi:hypothetical protein